MESNWRRVCGGVVRAGEVLLAAAALVAVPCAHATLGDYQTAVTNEPGILAYYTFEQSNANDARGLHNGTLQGTTAFAPGVAGVGTSLQLSGAGRVNLGLVPDFAFADGTGSVEAWVRAGNLGGNACIIANRDGSPTRYSIHMNSDKSGIGVWNGSAYAPTVAITNPSTNWHHLVVVFASDNYTVYWDGVLAGSTPRPLTGETTLPTQLGSSFSTGMSEGWVGQLDEVAFYADALPASAALAHYNAFFAGTPPVITTQPRGGTFLPGVPLDLSVNATGPSLTYQWYKGTSALAGKTDAVLSFPSLAVADAGSYSVKVINPAGTVSSTEVTVTLEPSLPAALTRYQNAVSNETSLISYYTFDRLAPADVFGVHPGTMQGTAGWGQGVGGGAAQALRLDGGGHVALGEVPDFHFASGTGTVEGWIRADWTPGSAGSAFPCMVADRNGPTQWSLHMNEAKTGLTCYNGMDSMFYNLPGGGAGTNWHHVAMVFEAGTATYYWDGLPLATLNLSFFGNFPTVQFGSSADPATAEGWVGMLDEIAFYSTALPATSILAHYNAYYLGDPPVITAQPVGGYYLVGQAGQVSVSASGAQLSYQWYKDDVLIPGATTTTIGSANLTADFSGSYRVQVSNPAGTVNSVVAALQVGNNITRYQSTVMAESSLVSYFTFDAGDGRDRKNAHPGTVSASVLFSSGAGGVTNTCITLDGTGVVDLGPVADFDFVSGNGTVEAWIRATWIAPAAYAPCVFSDRDGGSVWSIHMGGWKNEIGNWNGDRFQTQPIPNGDGWHHYTVTFGSGLVSMYWDGKPLGTFPQSINFNTAKTTQIGSAAPATGLEAWIGDIDEVAFYNSTLDQNAVWNHFLAMVGPDSAPALTITRSGSQVTLSWPDNATGYALYSTDSLAAPAWTIVNGVVGNSVTVDVSTGNRFYRLVK